MSGLLFLNGEDFVIAKGAKGNILCHTLKGFSLILFYSPQCEHCQTLIPIFKKLPGSINGCQFGMINVSTNKTCVRMSKSTIAPINYVPYIVLYVNGKPFMSYKGPPDANEIRRFVFEVAQKVKSNQKIVGEKIKEDPHGRGIPQYTIGHPLYGPDDKVCYLEFDTAYDKEGGQQGHGQRHIPVNKTIQYQEPQIQYQYQQPQQQGYNPQNSQRGSQYQQNSQRGYPSESGMR
jgi:thiol-disulfide isomerase/thioredoxin